MQISTKENGHLVPVSGVSSYPGFELRGYTVWCSCRFQLSLALGMTYFKTEPPSVKEFHNHLTVQ